MLKVFLLVLILASGIRFTALTFESLWLDEGYQTVVEAYGNNLPDLVHPSPKAFIYKSINPANVHHLLTNFRKVDPLCPPLFAVLINRWVTIFSGSDFSLRAFSALCSVLSIIAIYYFGSLLLGKQSALYAALLQTISPFDICYAQEARMYSLSTFLAIISVGSLMYLCLKKWSLRGIPFASLYIISTWALINTHYTQIFLWAFTIFIGFAIAISRKNWLLFCSIIICNLFILGLSFPWIPLFIQAASIRTASFYVIRESNLWWPLWALIIRIPFNWLTFLSGKKVMLFAIPVYITSLMILAYGFISISRHIKIILSKKNNKLKKFALILHSPPFLLVLWAIFPALMVWLLDIHELHRVVEIPRYLIGTAPAIYLLGGYSLLLLQSKIYFMPLILCHTFFCLVNNSYLHLIPQKENWRQMAQLIEQNLSPQDILFVSNYYNIICLDRYLHKPLKQIGLSANTGVETILKVIAQEKTRSSASSIFWLLSAQEGDAIFSTLPTIYKIEQKYDLPHALHLRKYKLEDN